MTENLERHQEKLEEKQAACLEQIQEMEKQVGVEGCEPLPMPTAELAWLQGAKGPGSGELPVRRWEERDWPLSWRGGGQGSGSQGVMRHLCRSLHLVGRPSPEKPPDGLHFPP